MAAGTDTERRYPLRDWLRIFHPEYRRFLAGMMALGIVGGVLTYLNLELLQGLVQTFSAVDELGGMSCAEAQRIFFLTEFLVCSGVSPGWVVAIIVLVAYICLELGQVAVGISRMLVESHLEIRSRNDIEREILLNLMRKDDQFFQRQSATQITNRLEEDTQRMFEKREDIAGLWAISIQALGAVAFLWMQHWSYAVAVLLFSLIGVYAIHRMLGHMRELDGAQLQSDDDVKAAFEDYLHAVPEAQMGNLSHKIAGQLGIIQKDRQKAFMGLVWLNGRLSVTYSVTQLVAFAAIMCAISYVVVAHGFTIEDGLIAAVVRAVPQLYGNISEVAKLFMKFQLAGVSARRLLEFETEADRDQPLIKIDREASSGLTLDDVRYAFTPGGQLQGGPEGISLSIPGRGLNVIVGPSGSGKSMVSQLLMGRLIPQAGRVAYGDTPIPEMSQANRAQIFSHMPQSLAMVSGTILDNLNFGLPGEALIAPDLASKDVRAWIDRTGVGFFAREKALDMRPDKAAEALVGNDLAGERARLREGVSAKLGLALVPFDHDTLIPHLTMLENLTKAAAAPDRIERLTFTRTGFQFLEELSDAPGAEPLIRLGRHVVERTQHILTRCPTYDSYIELAPFHIRPDTWQLRVGMASLFASQHDETAVQDLRTRGELLLVGLTAKPQEADEQAVREYSAAMTGETATSVRAACLGRFAEALELLDGTRLNTSLTWRDNLLFAAPHAVNTPAARGLDQFLIEALADTPLDGELLRGGLGYEIGRQGKRLSGGQRQLICLCRAILRDTPVLLLDEPTAALDPTRRESVNMLLRDMARERCVVVITHDADLARIADQVLMMRSGQLWAHGTFSHLSERDADFRSLVRLDGALA